MPRSSGSRVTSEYVKECDRVIVTKDEVEPDQWSACLWDPLDKLGLLVAINGKNGNPIGWELSACTRYLASPYAWEWYESEPEALLIDPDYAPEGARLKDLLQRV